MVLCAAKVITGKEADDMLTVFFYGIEHRSFIGHDD